VKYIFLLVVLTIFINPVFAEPQQRPTESGTLLVSLDTDPPVPTTDGMTKLKIDFLNPKTKNIQEHVDYVATVTKDGTPVFGPIPLTHTSTGSTTLPVEFKENGEYKITLGIEGIVFRPIPTETVTFTETIGPVSAQSVPTGNTDTKPNAGCLIATATFGTEMAPQVQTLREIRDNVLFSTGSGTAFMTGFNEIYYSFSPGVADLERQNPIFKELVRFAITPMLSTLSILNYVNVDSEQEMLGYGVGIILLNAGMYFVAPAVVLIKIRNLLRKNAFFNVQTQDIMR